MELEEELMANMKFRNRWKVNATNRFMFHSLLRKPFIDNFEFFLFWWSLHEDFSWITDFNVHWWCCELWDRQANICPVFLIVILTIDSMYRNNRKYLTSLLSLTIVVVNLFPRANTISSLICNCHRCFLILNPSNLLLHSPQHFCHLCLSLLQNY